MSQLAMRRVVIGEGVYPHGSQTLLHQSQLATWQIVAQSCAIFGGHSTTPRPSLKLVPRLFLLKDNNVNLCDY